MLKTVSSTSGGSSGIEVTGMDGETEEKEGLAEHTDVEQANDDVDSYVETTLTSAVETSSVETEKATSRCTICGDSAFCRNFGVIACESCKAFFRRVANKEPFGRCDGNCVITRATRTFCKKCRLRKCYSVGMRKELIKSRASPKNGRRPKNDVAVVSSSSESSKSPEVQSPSSTSGATPCSSAKTQAEFSRTDRAILARLSKQTEECISNIENAYTLAFREYRLPTDVDLTSPTIEDFVNLIEQPTKHLIKFAKAFNAFTILKPEQQIVLLKHSVLEVLAILSTWRYEAESQSWTVEQETVSAEPVIREQHSKDITELFGTNAQFSLSMQKVADGDHLLIKFLGTLSLFCAERATPDCHGEVEKIEETYTGALCEYCRVIHPNKPTLFANVLQKLTDVRQVTENYNRMLLQLDASHLAPLIVEVFDVQS